MRLAPCSGVEAGHVRAAVEIRDDASAGVVGRRYHGNRLRRDVDAEVATAREDVRKVVLEDVRLEVRDVQIQAVRAEALHLVVDGAGDDVPGGEFGALVEVLHEALAGGQAQQTALAAQGLGDEEALRVRMEQAGRMELVELHVRDPASGPPGHGDAVAGAAVGIRGVEVDLRGAPGGEHHEGGLEDVDAAGAPIEHVGPDAAGPRQADLLPDDQVHGDVLLEDRDVRRRENAAHQRRLHGRTRRVGGVQDASVAVPAFLGQMEALGAVGGGLAVEGDALIHQPLHGPGALPDHVAHRVLVAQARPGDERVRDVRLEVVGLVEHGRDPALGPVRGACVEGFLGQDRHARLGGEAEGRGQAGGPGTDDQDVELMAIGHGAGSGSVVSSGAGAGTGGACGPSSIRMERRAQCRGFRVARRRMELPREGVVSVSVHDGDGSPEWWYRRRSSSIRGVVTRGLPVRGTHEVRGPWSVPCPPPVRRAGSTRSWTPGP